MKKLFFTFGAAIVLNICAFAADTLKVYYFNNYPFAYKEDGKLKGIDVDIMKEYEAYAIGKKGLSSLVFKYIEYNDLDKYMADLKKADANVMGIGGITYTGSRAKDFNFSSSYLKNISVLVTPGSTPTIRENNAPEVLKALGSSNAVTVKNSTHETYINALRKSYLPASKVVYAKNLQDVLLNVQENKNSFAYVDLIAYWAFNKKSNKDNYLKMQRLFNKSDENFSFILPKNVLYMNAMNEFFDAGFGFTSTKLYREILDRYLGYEVIQSVEIK
jgi:ABC-type amino acid transport substrate-binding protein